MPPAENSSSSDTLQKRPGRQPRGGTSTGQQHAQRGAGHRLPGQADPRALRAAEGQSAGRAGGGKGFQPLAPAGRRVLPTVPTGWQQPPAAPAAPPPHSPPQRPRRGHSSARDGSTAARQGHWPGPPSPALGGCLPDRQTEESPAPSCSRGPWQQWGYPGPPHQPLRQTVPMQLALSIGQIPKGQFPFPPMGLSLPNNHWEG